MDTETLKRNTVKHGVVFQLEMLTEEIGEVLQAVNKVRRLGGMDIDDCILKPCKETSVTYSLAYFGLCGEVADLKITLKQIELLLDEEAINISIERRIERLKENLDK